MKRYLFLLLCMAAIMPVSGQVATGKSTSFTETRWNISTGNQGVALSNGAVNCSVTVRADGLLSDSIWVVSDKPYGFKPALITSDADFAIDLVWTGWKAPNTLNNSEGRIMLTKKDFKVLDFKANSNDAQATIVVTLHGVNSTLMAKLTYILKPNDYFVRRSITLYDTTFGHHFLHALHPVMANLTMSNAVFGDSRKVEISEEGSSEFTTIEDADAGNQLGIQIVKKGEYGQVTAIRSATASAFFGLEHPASENHIKVNGKQLHLDCSRPYGVLIDSVGITSEAVVYAVNPEPYVRKWYWNYLDQVRVAPDAPYTLYNSWYDLRSVDYPRVPEQHWMNQTNVERMVEKVHTNMTVNNGIKVDGFVLDDGWDVYKSDWVLRQPQFPNGLKPIADKLAVDGTKLGVWFGPIGGYSFRMPRISWMMDHGYEGINREYEYCAAFLCVGGTNYSKMFNSRIQDMITTHGVRYFKWDGMIFNCNEPDHGHRTGLYATVSTLEEFGKICNNARKTAPDVYLNITTGSWLSPWWLNYANQIWMDGSDYAFANVPSLTKRDNAITYRDFVLFDDLKNKDLWFPTSNLMTHGFIKGKLDHVGSNNEPLDKLTDDAMLYVARGVSMYELYISPDILEEKEWSAVAGALRWARDRYPILRRTEMVGGNPTMAEPYGYAHFVDSKGIVAMRNPDAKSQMATIELSPELGLNRFASSLVVEQVYPCRYVFPNLYSAGATIPVDLNGFETAIYEVYPVETANTPLVAGVVFNEKIDANIYSLDILGKTGSVKVLNPEKLSGSAPDLQRIPALNSAEVKVVSYTKNETKKGVEIVMEVDVPTTMQASELGFLFTNPSGVKAALPNPTVTINKVAVELRKEEQENSWGWRLMDIKPGKSTIVMILAKDKAGLSWKGTVDAWSFGFNQQTITTITFPAVDVKQLRPMPPASWPLGTVKQSTLLKTVTL